MKTKFKNKKTEYTFESLDWTGAPEEIVREWAWNYAKTAPMDAYLDGKPTELGVIRLVDVINANEGPSMRGVTTRRARQNETVLRALLSKQIDPEKALEL